LRRQSEKAAWWAPKDGYQIVEVLADLGVSAYRGKNIKQRRLGNFLALVEAGKIEPDSVLIVEPLGETTREVRRALPDFLSIVNAGIGIVTLGDEQIHDRDSIDRDYLQLFASLIVMAHENEKSRIRGQRVAAALANKRGRKSESADETMRQPEEF
jgi:DNA invertase Pin-like site-specific DNA recombinase